ncbi:MAG: putative metal-dependent HD superfamily phosphohydrolase [Saprospiraceae bacterium]|jgi:predicted metal-dependent HD superfamily phosphohydrolase
MTENNNILIKAEKKATEILKNQLSPTLTYHNYEHTKNVVAAVLVIGQEEKLDAESLEIVQLAAWFHDTGFRDAYEGHEEKSSLIATEFLAAENVAPDKIKKVVGCILVTKTDKNPSNNLEEIICDADMSHIAKEEYQQYADHLRTELSEEKSKKYTDIEWYQMNLEFVSRYKFHTSYGKEVLDKTKEKTRDNLQKKVSKLQKKADKSLINELGVTADELKAMKKKLQKAEGRPERGIETMFRLTSKNHLTLSGMADSKANIMISVNSIIISILIGSLMQKLDNNPHLIVPTVILLSVNLVSMVFSILSIRPNVTAGLFTREDIAKQKTNLLFFGNFHKMKRDDYHWGMNELMANASFLYSSLIDDIYFLGVVLATKYNYLRYSYNVFMYGIVVSVIAFVISNFFAVAKVGTIIPQ